MDNYTVTKNHDKLQIILNALSVVGMLIGAVFFYFDSNTHLTVQNEINAQNIKQIHELVDQQNAYNTMRFNGIDARIDKLSETQIAFIQKSRGG